MENVDADTVEGFGDEWQRFDQEALDDAERSALFDAYFAIFPWAELPPNAVGFDAGCGSGRWAALAARRVGQLHCIDASDRALAVARRNLEREGIRNGKFHHASIAEMPIADGSMDFGYSLGVLHHMPDTAAALAACVRKLKPGAPLLVYLYYAFDNRPPWFRALWRATDVARRVISRMPHRARFATSQAIAASIYWPLARSARGLEAMGFSVDAFPLSAYRERSFYVMRTDALDRFGTSLEQRFTRAEISTLMERAGLEGTSFSEDLPFWCAVGRKPT